MEEQGTVAHCNSWVPYLLCDRRLETGECLGVRESVRLDYTAVKELVLTPYRVKDGDQGCPRTSIFTQQQACAQILISHIGM